MADGGLADRDKRIDEIFTLSPEEARALFAILEKQYIDIENTLAVKVVYSLQKFVEATK